MGSSIDTFEQAKQLDTAALRGLLADARAPEFLIAIAAELLHFGAPDLQIEAFEALVRVGTPASLRRALAWLDAASPPVAVEACRRWARAETPEAVVRVLASAPADLREVALQALRGASWSVVEPLIRGDHALLLRAGYHAHPQLPIDLLARLVLETASVPALIALVKRLQALPALVPELVPLVAALRGHGERRREVLQAEAERARHTLEQLRRTMVSDGREAEDHAAVVEAIEDERRRRREYRQLATLEQELDRLSGTRGRSVR